MAFVLFVISAPLVYAQEQSEAAATLKDEVVYVTLSATGKVEGVYVVNEFDLSEDQKVIDYGNYTSVTNLTDLSQIEDQNGEVSIDAKKGKLYYEGALQNSEIPWDFEFKYYLNGVEKIAEELAGQTGALEIQMSIRKNPLAKEGFFESYALQATFEFDASKVDLQSAVGATVASAGKNKQLNYIILPNSEEDYIIKAQVKDFAMEPIILGGVKLSLDLDKDFSKNKELTQEMDRLKDGVAQLDDGAGELSDGAGELRDGVKEVSSGAKDLSDGAKKLNDGVGDLADGTAQLRDGVVKLTDGVDDLKKGTGDLRSGSLDLLVGAGKLEDGATQLSDGANELHKGSVEFSKGVSSTKEGMREFSNGLFDAVNGTGQTDPQTGMPDTGIKGYINGVNQMVDRLDQMLTLVQGLEQLKEQFQGMLNQLNGILFGLLGSPVELTEDNYQQILQSLINTFPDADPDAAEEALRAQTKAAAGVMVEQINTAIANDPSNTEHYQIPGDLKASIVNSAVPSQEQIDQVLQMAAMANAQKQVLTVGLQVAMVLDGVIRQLEGQLEGPMSIEETRAMLAIMKNSGIRIQDGLDQLVQGAQKLTGGTGELENGSFKIANGILDYSDGTKKYKDGVTEYKEGYKKFHDGVEKLDDGVLDLQNGVLELRDGSFELYDGTVELNKGTGDLYEGTSEFYSGTKDLYDGANSLYDGTVELKDGTGEFRDKTSNIDEEMEAKIKEAIKTMLGGEQAPESFVSEKNNVKSLQFVIKTPKIEIHKMAVQLPAAENLTIWQKFLNLFGWYNKDE